MLLEIRIYIIYLCGVILSLSFPTMVMSDICGLFNIPLIIADDDLESGNLHENLLETKTAVCRPWSFVNVRFQRRVLFSKNQPSFRFLNRIYLPFPRKLRRCTNILMSNLRCRASHIDRTNDGVSGRNPNLIHSRAPLSQPAPFVPA